MKAGTLDFIVYMLGNNYLYVDNATIKKLGAAFELLTSLEDNSFDMQSEDTQKNLRELQQFARMTDTPRYVPANDENIVTFKG